MNTRRIDLFDEPLVNARRGTTHVEAYVSFAHGTYTLFVMPYYFPVPDDTGLRSYPLSAGVSERLETNAARFSPKRLRELAERDDTRTKARALVDMTRT